LAELRRRSVFRVAGAYVVVGWLLVQAAGAFENGLNLPAWFDTVVIGLLALGFPVALVLAWAFELTPEGVKRAANSADGAASAPFARTDLVLIAALVAVLGVSVFQAVRPGGAPDVRSAGASDLSIAVLPFVNMSSDPEQEYFSDGLSEELLNVLAQIRELRVAGRTSSFAFKGRNDDLREIGQQLSVAHVLEGSVRKSGDRLRITAQLISVSDGYHLWSETYDRQLTDVFAVQEEIARAVVDALSITLGVASAPSVPAVTDDIAVYDLYLRARAASNSPAPESMTRAADMLREVIAREPNFTPARALLASNYAAMLIFAPERVAQTLPALEAAVADGLAHAPDDPGTLLASGALHLQRQEWLESEAAFTRANELSDGAIAGDASFWGVMLANVGRATDSGDVMRAQLRLDPLNIGPINGLQQFLLIAGREDEAEAIYQRALELGYEIDPVAHTALLRVWNGDDDALIRERFDRYIERQIVVWPLPGQLRGVYDDREAALPLIRAALDDPANQDPTRLMFVALYAGHYGDTELALAAARRALVDMRGLLVNELWFPDMAGVRRTDDFKELVRDLGLVDYWRATGNWGEFCRPVGADGFECS
jgi:TolB-like protein